MDINKLRKKYTFDWENAVITKINQGRSRCEAERYADAYIENIHDDSEAEEESIE